MASQTQAERFSTEILAEMSLATYESETAPIVRIPQTLPPNLSEKLNEAIRACNSSITRGEKILGTTFGKSATQWLMDYGIQCGTFEGISFTGYPFYETDDHNSTPKQIQEILGIAEVVKGSRVLEPSAGSGALVRELAKTGCEVCAIDSDSRNVNRIVNGVAGQVTTIHSRFEKVIPASTWQYDHVVMVPPTSRRDDLLHIQHAHKFLKVGGTMTAVVSECVRFRKDEITRDFEVFLARQKNDRIRKLKEQPFVASKNGTGLRLVCVTYTKKT